MKKRVLDLLVALAIALSLVAVACGPTPEPQTIVETIRVETTRVVEGEVVVVPETVEVEKEVVVIATPTLPQPTGNGVTFGVWGAMPDSRFCTLASANGTEAIWLRRLSAATLLSLDQNLQWSWDLAQDVEVSDDGVNVVFYLRDDVTWHDGAPFTSDDVVFTFDLILDPGSGDYYDIFSPLVWSVVAIDDYTVEFTLDHPINTGDMSAKSAWRSLLTAWTPLPKHLLEGTSAAEVCASQWAQSNYIGLGPYHVVGFDSGNYVTYEPYSGFYGYQEDSSLNPLDQIGVGFQDDPGVLFAALQAGQIDLVQTSPRYAGEIEQYPGQYPDLQMAPDTALVAVNLGQMAWPPEDPYFYRAFLEPPGETFVPYRESSSELADLIGQATLLPQHPETEAAIEDLAGILGGVRINKARTVTLTGNPSVVHLAPLGPESAPANQDEFWDVVGRDGGYVIGTYVVVEQDPPSEAERVQAFAVQVQGDEFNPQVVFVRTDGMTITRPITFEVPAEPAEIPSAGIEHGSFWCRGRCDLFTYYYPCSWW